jgi:hypothetical protein
LKTSFAAGFFSPEFCKPRSQTLSAGVLKYFQPNFFNAMPVAVQVSLKGRQHLPQFGSGRIGIDQQAPFRAFNGPRLDGISQGTRYERLQAFEPKARLSGELRQARQTGRFLGGFHERDCLIDFCHTAIMREPCESEVNKENLVELSS